MPEDNSNTEVLASLLAETASAHEATLESFDSVLKDLEALQVKHASALEEIVNLKKASNTKQIILQKVASDDTKYSADLLSTCHKLENAGLLKSGHAIQVYETIKSDPTSILELLNGMTNLFHDEDFESGSLYKEAKDSLKTPSQGANKDKYIDIDNWSKLLEKRH